jgi:hypothetical protein
MPIVPHCAQVSGRESHVKKIALGFAAAVAVAASPVSAAEYLFDFAGTNLFGGQPLVGSGSLFTSDITVQQNGRDAQKITGITGIYNGSAITGLNPTIFGADNFYYLTGNFVSGNGLGFNTASGTSANLFTTVFDQYRVNSVNPFQSGFVQANSTVAAVSAVPEPSTWAMMMLGFGAVGGAMRAAKRKRKLTFSHA